ncbi:DNA topology modulation protein [Geomicrobium sp. JCM 19037]|uniref:topology modulation protein n=1 Tax=Geomicrobium sp. JCM 19037 TaxID=1460634 RepID=UPI00045F1396|nr:topology modulation protein [Geomicrobium sp. JCM 19037]GAK04036.1 DNA topology modulation protein [Geomicrobium sp. JCM 19037]
MNRIMVMGVSPGVGKSTFARELGEELHMNVYHLDAYFWKPGWVMKAVDEFAAEQQEIVEREQWIIEGNYNNTYEVRVARADTIIYLELPLYVCLYRVFKRWIKNFGRTRSDMGEGCKEKLDVEFIRYIVTTYNRRKKTMKKRLQAFEEQRSLNQVIVLTNKKAIRAYLNTVSG